MSASFNAEEYVAKWDKLVIPAMSLLIVLALASVTWLQFATDKECKENEYIYCGPSEEFYSTGHH